MILKRVRKYISSSTQKLRKSPRSSLSNTIEFGELLVLLSQLRIVPGTPPQSKDGDLQKTSTALACYFHRRFRLSPAEPCKGKGAACVKI